MSAIPPTRQTLAATLALAAADVAEAGAGEPHELLRACVTGIEALRQIVEHARADLEAATSLPLPHPSAQLGQARIRARETSDRLAEARALALTAADLARAALPRNR